MGKSRRLRSKTCPSFENRFKNKGFPCKGDQSRTMASGSPCWWPLLLAWAGCWGADLPGMGPALQDSELAGSHTGTPRTKATDRYQVRCAECLGAWPGWGRGLDGAWPRWGWGLRGKLTAGSGAGHSRKGSCLAEGKQRVTAGDMGSSRRRESGISSCVTPGLGGADKILLTSRQG